MDDNMKVKKNKTQPLKKHQDKNYFFCFSISDAEGQIVECNK